MTDSREKLKILGPLITVHHPRLQLLFVPHPKTDFELLWLRRQTGLDSITLQRIENRRISLVFGRDYTERADESNVGGVELAISEVRAGTHSGTCTVSIVRRSTLTTPKEAFGKECLRVFEVVCIVIGSPCVL